MRHVAFNGDGDDEVLWRNVSTHHVAMRELSGRTLVNGGIAGTAPGAPEIRGIGDYDGDGGDEVLWFHTSTRQLAMWELSSRHVLVNGGIAATVPGDYRIMPAR